MKRCIVLLAILIIALPALAQERSGGAVYLVNPSDNENLNPLLCADTVCRQFAGLFFPTLLAIDPERAILTTSSGADRAMALEWATEDGLTYTFTLRDDLTWDNVRTVSAYDVFYSYLAIRSSQVSSPYRPAVTERIRALLPLDPAHLVVVLDEPMCDVLDVVNFPVIPSHVFEPGFAAVFTSEADDYPAQLEAWLETDAPDFSTFANNVYNYTLPVTLAGSDVNEIRGGDSIRLTMQDKVGAYIYTRISTAAAVDYFLNGALDYIYHPPHSRWNDILASDANPYIYPGYTLEYIGFNLSDPEEPLSYRDEDGNIQAQLPHPILSDLRVRQAIQMGIDVQALMDAAVEGYGTPLATNQPPGSWALNPDLTAPVYDPEGAKHLLDEAGWKAAATDNLVRTCLDCEYAETGDRLVLNMLVTDSPRHDVMARLITEQLRYIGIRVDVVSGGVSDTRSQSYDMILADMTLPYPANPHEFDKMFFVEEDVLRTGENASSYDNPEVVRLLEDARTYPGCDTDTRADLYHQVQAILSEDLPYLWLFAPNEMIAVRGWVQNTQMYPYQPFWNLEAWAVNYEQGN